MQTAFQLNTHRTFAEFAQGIQLSPYRLVESGNGTEYKNHLNDTVLTVYHDRLDDQNRERIELAIGVGNISTELSRVPGEVAAWLSRTQLLLHPAESKSPLWWPRVSVWSPEEVQLFCRAFNELLLTPSGNIKLPLARTEAPNPAEIPPVDERVMREILSRRGQAEFRTALLRAYDGTCAVSGCADTEVLEAAHIMAHSESQDYLPTNGLLLRADLHTLFDLRLVSIDPRSAAVVVSRRLSSVYQGFNGCTARLPDEEAFQPDASALMRHFLIWQASEQSVG
jgi:hypothetical protein